MKKFLSIILAVILICSVMMPLSVFAENGPYPIDWETIKPEDMLEEDFVLSIIAIMNLPPMDNFNSYDDYMEACTMAVAFPNLANLPGGDMIGELLNSDPNLLKGVSYNKTKNTLTLKNVRLPYSILTLSAMGDDFKIKLVGYNELASISSDGMNWGGSVTLTGSGELVLNKAKSEDIYAAVDITATETPSFFKAEKDVNLKIYADTNNGIPAFSVVGSTLTDASKLVQLEGKVKKGGAVLNETYTIDVFETLKVYDMEWNTLPTAEIVFTKEGTDETYIGFEEYDENSYEPTGKYYIYPVTYDETLKMNVAIPNENEPVKPSAAGYAVKKEGAVNATLENIFIPDYQTELNIALAEDGTKFGFEVLEYDDDYGEETTEYTVYKLIEHPEYGFVSKEIPTQNDLDGLTAQKIGEKQYANAWSFNTFVVNNGGSVLPKDVTGIKLANVAGGIQVSWSPITRATKYKIYRKAPGETKWTAIKSVGGDETSYIDTSVKSGSKYSYTVKACNIVGWGSCNLTGVSLKYLAMPQFKLANDVSGVKVSWSKIGGAEKYRVYRKAPGDKEWTRLTETAKLTFTDKTAKNNVKYTYTVKAISGKVASKYKAQEIIRVASPKNIVASNTLSGVNISWSKVGGADKYRVYRKAPGETKWTALGYTTKTSFADTNVKNNKVYSYTVKAYNGSYKSEVDSKGDSVRFLKAPVADFSPTAKGPKLTWAQVSGATGYKVYRRAVGEKDWTLLKSAETNSFAPAKGKCSFVDPTAKNGVLYEYALRSYCKGAQSASQKDKFMHVATPKLTGKKNTDDGIKIAWGKVSGADKYRVYRKAPGETKWTAIGYTTNNKFVDTNVKEGKTYTYTVKAYNDSYTSNVDAKGISMKYSAPDVIVYKTATGSKYHYENPCGNGTYYATTLTEAVADGLTPCEKCVLH